MLFLFGTCSTLYLARARARALPTVGSPAPVRRGLWSLPSSCPSSRTTGRFSRARCAMGAPWARYERTMCACISGVTFKITSPFLKTKRKWQHIARFDATYVVVLGGMVAASTGNGHDIFMIFLSLKFIFYGKILFVF